VSALPATDITIEVDTTDDSNAAGFQDCTAAENDCSLRGAVSKANGDTGNDYTIIVPSGVYTLTEVGAGDDSNAIGDLDVLTDLTISGAGSGTTMIHGNEIDRVLHVHSGVTIVVDDVTIAYGKTPDGSPGGAGGDGGGILNSGTLTLTASLVISNTTGKGGDGSGSSGGRGGFGGGIYNEGVLVLLGTDVMTNTTGQGGICDPSHPLYSSGPGGSGGAIYSGGPQESDVSVTIHDSTIKGNVTGSGVSCGGSGGNGGYGGSGGGVCNGGVIHWGGPLLVVGSRVIDNHTGNGATHGGGAGALPGSGGSGGGIYSYYETSVTVRDSIIGGNTTGNGANDSPMGGSGGSGGGIVTYSDVPLVVHNSMISDNHTGNGGNGYLQGGRAGWGGGIVSTGPMTMTHSTVSGNTLGMGGSTTYTGGSIPGPGDGANGGGIVCGSTTSIVNSTVSGNQAGDGGSHSGGIYTTGGDGGSGGGIYFNGQQLTLTNTSVPSNTCGIPGAGPAGPGAPGYGGGLATYAGTTTGVSNTILANNINPNGNPYGVDCYSGGTLNSGGYNLVENGCAAVFVATGDLTAVDPLLGDLADNGGMPMGSGGAAWTHALLPGSPALDVGSCPGYTADQRGFPRPVDIPAIPNLHDGCDIGAFEAQATLTLAKTVDDDTVDVGQRITFTVHVTSSGFLTATNAVISDSLPPELEFAGPITLDPAGAGTVGSTPPILVSDLTITGGTSITVTFPVTVVGGTVITNTAAITSTEVVTPRIGWVSIQVSNAAPIAVCDSYETAMDTPLVVPAPGVLENDVDPNGDPLVAMPDSAPLSGTLALEPDGSFAYTPTVGFVGPETFTYHAHDGVASSNVATVTISVTSPGLRFIYLPIVLGGQ
jgi:uncharacterized repeat protein (TIGR01451 family)